MKDLIIEVKGGLGNQIFQFAFGYALARDKGKKLVLDTSYYDLCSERSFGLESAFGLITKGVAKIVPNERGWNPLRNIYYSFLKQNKFIEKQFNFDPQAMSSDAAFYCGYWQTSKYFESYVDELRAIFKFNNELLSDEIEWVRLISMKEGVSVHIRRGDYIQNPDVRKIHEVCTKTYFERAVDYLLAHNPNLFFFVFSDDLNWCRKEFSSYENFYFFPGTSERSWVDLYLMSLCQHNIISNSTFSWWGAWLNPNKNKIVICPSKWFNVDTFNTQDIYPSTWIRI